MLTKFQHRQLLSLHFTGELLYRSDKDNRWPRGAWVKMIDKLLSLSYMDEQCRITPAGEEYLDKYERGQT